MKELIIMRHAKTMADSVTKKDIDRKLEKIGVIQAKNQGGFLKELGFMPDLILVSPSARTQQTLENILLANHWDGVKKEINTNLYMASLPELLDIIHLINPQIEKVLLIGHNFGVYQLVQSFCPKYLTRYKTGSMTHYTFKVDNWLDISMKNATLKFIKEPDDVG